MAGPRGDALEERVLRRWAAAALGAGLALSLQSPAGAAPNKPGLCHGHDTFVSVCADTPGEPAGKPEKKAKPAASGKTEKPRYTCRVTRLEKQPAAGSGLLEGHSSGALYQRTCPHDEASGALNGIFAGQGEVFYAEDPPEAKGPDPRVLAQQAMDEMELTGPQILSPKAGGEFTVGVPVWMRVAGGDSTYGPNSATAEAGGVSVTAKARVKQIVWSMGDGKSVTCTSRGAAYKKSYGLRKSPDCGHQYSTTSADAPGGKFTVTATSTWGVEWEVSGGGENGTFEEQRESQVEIPVGESQVVGGN